MSTSAPNFDTSQSTVSDLAAGAPDGLLSEHCTCAAGVGVTPLADNRTMPYIPGYMRGGRRVRPHYRRGPTSSGVGGIALVALALVLINGPLNSSADGGVETTRVTSVIDGDTIGVRLPDGTAEKVRILGIDSPELRHGKQRAECGGNAAKKALTLRLAK